MTDTTAAHDKRIADSVARYEEARAAGLHDELCGNLPALGFHLCHCAKRAREARGVLTPPTLTCESPTCDGCDATVSHDADGWVCHNCNTTWGDGSYGQPGTFHDVYGDDLAAESAAWKARRDAG